MNDARKRLRYQSWHRGCKETDDILGPFADHYLPDCSDEQAKEFAALLTEDDWDIWRWLSSGQPMPPEHRALLEHIRSFQMGRHS